jgi:hypothetical protein
MNPIPVSASEQKVLHRAVSILKRDSLVAKLPELTGERVTRMLLPRGASNRIHRTGASHSGLSTAVHSDQRHSRGSAAGHPSLSGRSRIRTLLSGVRMTETAPRRFRR